MILPFKLKPTYKAKVTGYAYPYFEDRHGLGEDTITVQITREELIHILEYLYELGYGDEVEVCDLEDELQDRIFEAMQEFGANSWNEWRSWNIEESGEEDSRPTSCTESQIECEFTYFEVLGFDMEEAMEKIREVNPDPFDE